MTTTDRLIGRIRPYFAPAMVVASAIVCYSGILDNEFVGDDHQIVEQHPIVNGSRPLHEAFTTPYHGLESEFRVYRPLAILSLAVQWSLHGGMPALFHLASLLLHAAVSLLVWFFARAMARDASDSHDAEAIGFASGLLFAVHAINSDVVCPVVGRSDELAVGFSILSFLTWRAYVFRQGHGWLVACAILFLAGLASKESSAPLPLFAAVWTVLVSVGSRTAGQARDWWRVGLAGILTFGIPVVSYLLARSHALGAVVVSGGLEYFAAFDGPTTFLTLLGIFARYFWLTLVPWPLTPCYSWRSILMAGSALEPWPLAGLILVPVFIAVTMFLAWRRSPAGFGLLWFALFLLPATHVVPLMIPMAERLAHASTVGSCLALATAWEFLWARSRSTAVIVLAVFAGGLGGLSVERTRVWHDEYSLWSDVVDTVPDNAMANANLGGALLARGDVDGAIERLVKALEIMPRNWAFRVALADILHETGHHADEARWLMEGLRVSDRLPPDPIRICRAIGEVAGTEAEKSCETRIGMSTVF